jgi:hypothetical protein
MYEAVMQSEEKTILEAHQRYIDFMRAAENSGYRKGVEETQAKADAIIAAKDEALAAKDAEIARLKALLGEQ